MAKQQKLACACGTEFKGTDAREVEAKMWHHAIHDHEDMVKGMSVEQFADIMKGWDKQLADAR